MDDKANERLFFAVGYLRERNRMLEERVTALETILTDAGIITAPPM